MARRRNQPAPPAETAPDLLCPAERVHFELLGRWRGAMDLVGPGPMVPHFIDAARAVDALGPISGAWIDLGSGAGFPGIALAARNPQTCTVLMVESRRKRATFLDTVLAQAQRLEQGQALGHATVLCDRSEKVQGPFDGVISRAYKAPQGVLVDAKRLLRPGGRVALMLGDSDAEIPPGWRVLSQSRYAVPDGYRRLVVLQS